MSVLELLGIAFIILIALVFFWIRKIAEQAKRGIKRPLKKIQMPIYELYNDRKVGEKFVFESTANPEVFLNLKLTKIENKKNIEISTVNKRKINEFLKKENIKFAESVPEDRNENYIFIDLNDDVEKAFEVSLKIFKRFFGMTEQDNVFVRSWDVS